MLVTVLAMGLSFINPQMSSFAYLLIPILQGVLKYRHRKVTGGTV